MRKLFMLAAFLCMTTVSANAQDEYPSAEIFGGYSYLNADFFDRESLHGWGLSFAGNLGPRVGAVAEFSGHYGEARFPLLEIDSSVHTFLFGPRISARSESVTAFGHILLGGARTKFENFESNTNFAMAIGGGVDIKASKSVAVRLLQADYLPIRSGGEWDHNFRLQAGIVFRLGGE